MNNQSPVKCPQCGALLKESALAGLCPSCLMALNLKTETAISGAATASQPPLPPEQIAPDFPQLEILECLGRGGMGVVYKARQKTLNRFVALKLLAPERAGDPQFATRFEKEARALAAMNHPNIVTIHDHGRAGGFYYLLMEFVDGVTLRQLLSKGRVSPHEALAIVPQICDALQFAHDQGIVHRDIKPENILLDRRGRVKVADFGLAKIVGNEGGAELPLGQDAQQRIPTASQSDAGKVMGTPQYMSPEQVHAPGEVDHRADIYALGVVLYQMLTGELPGKNIEPPSKKVQLDVRLDEIVLRALEKNPELRFQQASLLKTQVETLTKTSSTGGGLASAAANLAAVRPSKMRWRVWLLRLLIIVGVVVAVVFVWKLPRHDSVAQRPRTGLVSLWHGDGNALDETGLNPGEMAAGVTAVPGKIGRGFGFNGAGGYVWIPASERLNVGGGTGMTFETWIKPDNLTMQVIAEWNDGQGNEGAHMWISVEGHVAGDGAGNLYVNLYDTEKKRHHVVSPAGLIVPGVWQHVAVTYDRTSGKASLYRDGVLVGSESLGQFTPQTRYDFYLGCRASGPFRGTWFKGSMDEPALYYRELSPREIEQIYQNGLHSLPP